MAYKNKNKNKKHLADLKKVGWRLSNRKKAAERRGVQNLKDFGISEQKQIESIMKMQDLI